MNNSTTNETDFDEMAYLAEMLGPQRQPWDKLIPMTCVYIVMSITGIFGNLSVCCVILRIPSMRSATNYYLFSLAISDLLILLVGKYYLTKKLSKINVLSYLEMAASTVQRENVNFSWISRFWQNQVVLWIPLKLYGFEIPMTQHNSITKKIVHWMNEFHFSSFFFEFRWNTSTENLCRQTEIWTRFSPFDWFSAYELSIKKSKQTKRKIQKSK